MLREKATGIIGNMSAKLTVLAGPPRSGKTRRLLVRYRRTLLDSPPGAAIWLAPTWRAAMAIRSGLLDGECSGLFSPGVMTFEKFADAVLEVAPRATRPISAVMKRYLVRWLIDDQLAAGRLRHFGPIARTGGLVDLVCELISELKRLEIWPQEFHQACQRRGITQKDVELFEIYDTYQQWLREHELYDAEGRFWSARALMRNGQRRPWERLKLVVADGFTDFTRTQHEIIEILAERVEEIFVTLPLEAEPRRSDLLAKPLKTLGELKRRHQRRVVLQELRRPDDSAWPAMAHLEKCLFRNPRRARPAESVEGIEILPAARQLGEIEMIGRRIKRLLSQGAARPGEIAVVFRSPQDAGSLVAEVFDSLGIPFAVEAGQTLDRSPAIRALVMLLKLDVEDWPFEDLLALIGSNYFRPEWPEWQAEETAIAAEQTIRHLQIPRGRERLFGQLRTDRAIAYSSRDGRDQRSRFYGEAVAASLRRLAAAFDALPEKATLARWTTAWQRLAEETGLLRAIEQELPGVSQCPIPDKIAWTRMMHALNAGDTLAGWLRRRAAELNRSEALAALLDILRSERPGTSGDESGQVRVLSAASVRTLQVPYLFLAGLSEKGFPTPDRDDRLYSEAESRRLIDEGLPLVARSERNREEMLLFYEAICRATRRLYLSYPAMDEAAQPLSPSPFLTEVEQACGSGRIRRTDLPDLSPVPDDDKPLCLGTFRTRAMATALAGNVSLLAGLLRHDPPTAENLLAGLKITQLRQGRQDFSAAEGILSGDAAQRELGFAFNLERTFSATELEQYAACPYRFFLERVLKLEPIEDLELAVDFLERGRLAHAVLAVFHRRVNEALGRPGSPLELDTEVFDRLMEQTIAEQLGEQPANPVSAALREVDRRLLLRWIAGYRDQHERYDAMWQECDSPLTPEFFEVSFGRAARQEAPPSTERPLEFSAGGQIIRFAGRIDRIDTGKLAGQTVFNVLDYKTGGVQRVTVDSVAKGLTLQLPLYALAAAELLLADRRAVPWRAGYWAVRDKGFRPIKAYVREGDDLTPQDDWREMQIAMAGTIAALVRGIHRGKFPVCCDDPRCTGYCPFRTVCRINQVRSLEKTWRPTDEKD